VQLLAVILHSEELLDDVLSTLVEMGAPDAVVVESRSGLELLERDLPIFAGLRALVPSGIDFSSLVLCVLEDEGTAREILGTLRALESAAHGFDAPRNTAVLLPVTKVESF
jgi:hypothetical protein